MDTLEAIYQYRRLSPRLATAGQPTPAQLALIAQAGFEMVINLGLLDTDYALDDEAGLVRALGLRYVHIPVIWQAPQAEELDRFIAIMGQSSAQRVLVHCAANKRASVFVALYRALAEGRALALARGDVHSVWNPNPLWQAFFDGQWARLMQGINAQR